MKRLFATGVCAGGIAAIMTELSGPIGMISWVFFIAMLSYYATGLKTRETIIDAFFTNKFEPEGVSKGSVPKVEAFRKYESSHIN